MTTVIKAERVFDGKSDTLLRDNSVVVEGNKIVSFGNSARTPAGAVVIELGDATLSLGLYRCAYASHL